MYEETSLFGIGKGGAQVFDTSGLVNQYQRQIELGRKRREAEDEQLSKYVADFDYDRVKDADIPPIRKEYESILQLNKDYINAKDKNTRLALKTQIGQKMNQLGSMVQGSRNAKDWEKEYYKLTLNRNNKLMPGFGDKFSQLRQTSTFDPSYKTLASDSIFQQPFEPEYDLDKTSEEILKAGTLKVNKSPYATTIKGAPGTYIASQTGTKFDPKLAKAKFETALKDEGFAYGLNKRYNPDGKLTPEQVVNQAWNDILTEGQRINNVNTSVSGRVDRQPKTSSGSSGEELYRNVGTTRVPYADGYSSSSALPEFEMKDTVSVSLPADDLIGQRAYNITTGTLESVPNVIGNARVVAIGSVPYIKDGKVIKTEKGVKSEKSLKGAIAQPSFIKKNGGKNIDWKTQVMVTTGGSDPQTYLVDVDKVPRSKKFVEALNAHQKSLKPQSQPTAKPESSNNYKYKASNGKEQIFSNDGKTWFDSKGKKIQ